MSLNANSPIDNSSPPLARTRYPEIKPDELLKMAEAKLREIPTLTKVSFTVAVVGTGVLLLLPLPTMATVLMIGVGVAASVALVLYFGASTGKNVAIILDKMAASVAKQMVRVFTAMDFNAAIQKTIEKVTPQQIQKMKKSCGNILTLMEATQKFQLSGLLNPKDNKHCAKLIEKYKNNSLSDSEVVKLKIYLQLAVSSFNAPEKLAILEQDLREKITQNSDFGAENDYDKVIELLRKCDPLYVSSLEDFENQSRKWKSKIKDEVSNFRKSMELGLSHRRFKPEEIAEINVLMKTRIPDFKKEDSKFERLKKIDSVAIYTQKSKVVESAYAFINKDYDPPPEVQKIFSTGSLEDKIAYLSGFLSSTAAATMFTNPNEFKQRFEKKLAEIDQRFKKSEDLSLNPNITPGGI